MSALRASVVSASLFSGKTAKIWVSFKSGPRFKTRHCLVNANKKRELTAASSYVFSLSFYWVVYWLLCVFKKNNTKTESKISEKNSPPSVCVKVQRNKNDNENVCH